MLENIQNEQYPLMSRNNVYAYPSVTNVDAISTGERMRTLLYTNFKIVYLTKSQATVGIMLVWVEWQFWKVYFLQNAPNDFTFNLASGIYYAVYRGAKNRILEIVQPWPAYNHHRHQAAAWQLSFCCNYIHKGHANTLLVMWPRTSWMTSLYIGANLTK